MTILDYIFLGALALGLIIGIWKGFVGQIFTLAGVVVVAIGTTYLAPYPNQWMESLITSEGTRSIVSLIVTFVVLMVVYIIITKLITKAINKIPALGWINRLLGAVLSVAVVYLVFSVIIALVIGTNDGFLPKIKELLGTPFKDSWVVNNIYGGEANQERNFFGNWLLGELQKKIESLLPAFGH